MYVVRQGVEEQPSDSSGAVQSVLRQCVALTGLGCAFVAVERQVRGRSTISIRARYSSDGQQLKWRLSRDVRWAIHAAIESGTPLLAVGQRRSRALAYPRVLMVAPVLGAGQSRTVLGALGYSSAPHATTVRSMQKLANTLHASDHQRDPAMVEQMELMRTASARQDIMLHELRVPLSAAGLLLERLESLSSCDAHGLDGAQDFLSAAHVAVKEAQSIVRHFSQLQALNQDNVPITVHAVQVQAILERAVALLPGSLERMRYVAPVGLPPVAADPLWLTHILTNLLENALTHSPASRPADVTATLSRDQKKVVVSITSYGAGIPQTEQELMLRAPQPRRRLSKASDDLTSKGLGLRIARYLVTAMHGDMWMTSNGTDTTTFGVALPVSSHGAS